MSARKHKFKEIRKEFKQDLKLSCGFDRTMIIAIINAYVAYKHRRYIHKLHYFLGSKHPPIWREYCNTGESGKMLCGDDSIWKTLHFIYKGKGLYEKYRGRIPERCVLGDAYAVALQMLKAG
jgi:hypothetical protein